MSPKRALTRQPGSARVWIAFGVLAPICMVLVSGLMLLDLRRDAWDKASLTSNNLLQVILRDIARNVEIFDLSLRAVVDNLKAPGFEGASSELRQLILFDRAATARDMGVLLVLDEHGDIAVDSGSLPPRKANYADRDYFKAHQSSADLGLYVGGPLTSRLTGERMLPFSRRINRPDGSFGGVVVGTLKLSYFSRLFDKLGLGPNGAVNLYYRDGTRIMRQPFVEADIGANISGTANFDRFVREGRGSFVGNSVRDGISRLYTFTGVGDLPLVLDVALASDEIEAEWRGKALVISIAVLALSGLTIVLCILFGRELRRRTAVEAELAHLSLTDALTGLSNRRRFEQDLVRAVDDANHADQPLSLLVLDADHFKRFNDRFGHAIGDEILKGLARCLSASVHRPQDLVCRIGGEEFAVLLPDTDQSGAHRVAERLHADVAKLQVASVGIAAGSVTVSIGLAMTHPEGVEVIEPTNLYRLADAALYKAKAGGRNQTQCAKQGQAHAERRQTVLKLIAN